MNCRLWWCPERTEKVPAGIPDLEAKNQAVCHCWTRSWAEFTADHNRRTIAHMLFWPLESKPVPFLAENYTF